MRSKKLRSIVAMAAMTGLVSMASNGHTTKKIDKKLLASNEVASNNSSSSSINPNDLNIQISNISVTKESADGFTNNTDYVPENSIPKTTNIATSNTEMVYKIAVSLSSKTGKLYKVPKLYLTANPFAQYMDKNSDDPKEKQAAEEIVKSINMQLGQLKNLNSTSTFVITAILRVGSSDWDVNVKPNIELHALVGDKEKVVPVQVPDIRLTNHYTDTVYAGIQIGHSEENKHESYLDIGFSNANTSENNPGIYNPANYKPQSITFKINNPDPKDLDIIPLNVAGFSTNPDGTYTVDSRLIGQVNRLFKVITKTNGVLNKEITVTPISEKYNTNVDLNKTTTFNYDSASATLTQNAIGDSFSMSQNTEASSWYAPYDTFSSQLSAGIPGKYKIYSGSLLSNGNIVVIDGKDFIGLEPQTYVSLNQNAENIFLTGTPTEKANLFQRIVNGDMAGIGQSFSYDQILQMYKSGEKIPTLNFTYKSEDYNGNPLKMVGYYHEIPTKGAWTPLINRVFTLGVLQGNYSKQEKENMANAIGNGGLSSDTIIKNNGEFSGFLLSPPNNITNEDMDESKPVETRAENGTYHTTEIRYGSISHDISSTVTYAYEKVTTTIDTPKGSGNIIQNHPVSWLDSSHKFYFYIYGYGSGVTEQYTKNTVLEVNMGAPFVLTSPVTINGVTVPKEDCKIEGNKLFIKFPQRFNMSPQPTVEFDAHYITFGPQTITVSGRLVGETGDQGIVYDYNNNPNASQITGGAANQVILTNHQILTGDTSSDCMHYANDIDSNDNVTLTDVIHNGKYTTKDYLVVGQIPTAGSDNLPGNEGSPGVGGLGSKLLSLDTHGVPTWVLPKSALNSTNQKILDDPDALDLKGMLQYIESPESGWVKYIPGETDLSDMIAYAVTPTIEPGQDYILDYQVHLTGITPNNYQIVNSAFKYYIPTDEVGSTSNIVNLTPPGENLSYDWISKVVDSDGHALPNNVLNNTVDYNGHKISLNDLIGHGADNDGNFDLTPTELQNKVDLATNKEAMQKLGYKLDGIYVNGQEVSKEWFETVGILDNSTLTHIKFVVSKTYTDTVKIVDKENKELVPENSVSGIPGSDTDLKTPDIPKGYHIENITDGSGKTITELPKTFGNKNEIIIYHVVKDPSTTVAEVYKDGTNVVPIKTTLNAPNAKVDTAIPELPNGYQITKITVNGKVVSQNEVPTVQSENDQTIIYTIGKVSTDTVKVVDENNQPVVPEVSVTGVSGTETGLKTPEIPNGYHIVSVTNNGKTVEPGVPSKFTNDDQNIVYHIAKDPSTTVEEVYSNGTPVVTSKTTVNLAGTKVDTAIPDLPNGYQITKITVNGKVVSQNEVPNVQSKDNQTIVYTIDKMPTDTVKVMYNNTELVPSVSKTGKTGTETGLNTPEIPKGYHIVSITNGNGEKVTGVPKTFGNSDNTTIYHVEKDITDKVYVDVKTESGTVLTPSHEVASGAPGAKVNVQMPEIPKDYHIVKVIVDGNVIKPDANGKYQLPNTLSNNQNQEIDNHIDVIVAKNPTTTVEEKYQDGTNVVPDKTTINLQGTKVETGLPKLPEGYKVIKITVNGKEVSQNEVPTVQSADNQTIIYTIGKVSTDTGKIVDGNDGGDITHHLEKDITDKVYINVVTQSGDILVPNHQIASGKPGSKIDINIPNIPDEYHITKVIVNDNTLTPDKNGNYQLPKTLSSDKSKEVDYNIKVIVARNTSSTTINEVYSSNNKDVVPSKTITGTVGSKVDTSIPELPNGYKIEKIIVNGNVVDQSEVPTVQGNTNNNITYVIGKISNNDDHNNSTPDKPSHDNTGNTTSGNHNNVDSNKPSDSTHNNDDNNNNTPDKPSHDNTGNTTSGNHNNVDPNKPSDSTHNNDDHNNNIPDKPNHDNTGNTTGDNHNNVDPNKPSDSTHNNDNHNNNIPDKPNHDNTGNTTGGNHNNVDPNKPSDTTHNNDDHNNNTPDNPSHDNIGNTTGDNHNSVDHNKPSDSTHNNDNHKNDIHDKASDNNTGNTTNDNNHKNVKPTKPVDTGNTESNKIINSKVDNTNESNNTTSKSNVDINSTSPDNQINELPHTGLSNNDNNVAKEAGVLAGILSTLAALFFFRKKK